MPLLPERFLYFPGAGNVHCGPVASSAEDGLREGSSRDQLLQKLGRLSVTGRMIVNFSHLIFCICKGGPLPGMGCACIISTKVYQLLFSTGNVTVKCN